MDLFDFETLDTSDSPVDSGFRLHKLDVYNWGTFDKAVWSFEPKGKTALLTGEVGSGKSTLIDALITLFVPPRKAAYNKAADASARERDITSYVHGYYGQKRGYEGKGKPEALRTENQYSVILVTFKDEFLAETVSLAQFFWFREAQMKPLRFYVVSEKELFIDQDFSNFNADVKQLKARLKNRGSAIFDDYRPYAACFRKKLGDLSEQAIDLFQQTVSMKKVEALTDFVKNNMLEEPNADEDVQNLMNHYHDLSTAHEAVIRARRQIKLLAPIHLDGTQYTLKRAEYQDLVNAGEALDVWIARKSAPLYDEAIRQAKQTELTLNQQFESAMKNHTATEEEIDRIKDEILKNGGGAIDALKKELKLNNYEIKRRENRQREYNQYAIKVGLQLPLTFDAFNDNRKKIADLEGEFLSQKEIAGIERDAAVGELKQYKSEKTDIETEIASLRSRTSNIPGTLIKLRERICFELQLNTHDLPFIGELLEVQEEQVEWEGAIERLLRSFALSLLVSAEHYAEVASWVNKESLGTRLVYFRVNINNKQFDKIDTHMQAACRKLNIKSESRFHPWLIYQLAKRFDHVCCEDINSFRMESRAITKTGQIKARDRHEKDDRNGLNDRTRYVLGFSNKKKIDALSSDLASLDVKIASLDKKQRNASQTYDDLGNQIQTLENLIRFDNFSAMNVNEAQAEESELKHQLDQLRSANDILKTLEKQKESLLHKNGELSEEIQKLRDNLSDTKKQIHALISDRQANDHKLEHESMVKFAYPYLEKQQSFVPGNKNFCLENADRFLAKYTNYISERKEKVQEDKSKLETKICLGMSAFKRDYPNETSEMDSSIESLKEYEKFLTQLQEDDLPKYEERFKYSLQSNVITDISIFHGKLNMHYGIVKKRIEKINASLYGIDYNPGRYIRIECEETYDAQIKEFKQMLKSCTEGATDGFADPDIAESKFLLVKQILERFMGRQGSSESDARWTKKVTDVRNWFTFSASERLRLGDVEYEHYTDSGGKSGGQKEKLAYTILAASLVYNFGLKQDDDYAASFRFVAIDEAFLKSSDEASKYGLKLFKRLNFQLLVVTPLLKISTIEPFISHVGFVTHYDAAHISSLQNIQMEEYKERRSNYAKLDEFKRYQTSTE